MIRLKFEPRLDNPAWVNVLIPVAAVVFGLFAGGLLFFILGVNPFEAYWAVLNGAGSIYGLSEIVTKPSRSHLPPLPGSSVTRC